MKFRGITLVAILLCGLVASSELAVSQDSNAGSTLQVKITYTGAGTVDEKHKVYVVLWDSTDFMKGGSTAPIALMSTSSKSGSVTFSGIAKSPVYISAVFDTKGEWDVQSGPPPKGSPLGLYSTNPGEPAPVELKAGKTTNVELSFDDSYKMGDL